MPDRGFISFSIERGDRAYGSDGELGTVEQLIVDKGTGEQQGIVVRRAEDGREFELPVDLIQTAAGGEVHLNLTRGDLSTRSELARPYDPSQYEPVYPGEMPTPSYATRIAEETGHPVVTSIGPDAAKLVAPQSTAPTDTAAAMGAAEATQAQKRPAEELKPSSPGTEPAYSASRPTPHAATTPYRSHDIAGAGASAGTSFQTTRQPAPATLPQPPVKPLEEMGAHSRSTMPLLASVGGVGALVGVVSGVSALLRRRNSPEYRARKVTAEAVGTLKSATGTALDRAQVLANQLWPATRQAPLRAAQVAQELSRQAQERARLAGLAVQETRSQMRRSAKRTAQRMRWFRRGLVLGAAVALLYAPQSGVQLRAWLSAMLDRWTSHDA